MLRSQFLIDQIRVALIGELKLIAQVQKAIVDRGCGKHQYFRLHSRADDLVHETKVSVLTAVVSGDIAAVSEVVRLIDDDEVVIAPVEPSQVKPVRCAAVPRKVRMVQHVVPQTVGNDRVVDVVVLEGVPVVRQFFWAQHEDGAVAVFIILDDRKCGECFAEADAVREDAPVERFQFVDDRQRRVLLEGVELAPDRALLEAGRLVGQHVLGGVLQKFPEDGAYRHKVDEFRRVFVIRGGDAVDDLLGHVLHQARVVPYLAEHADVLVGKRGEHLVDRIDDVVAAFASDIGGGESVKRHIGRGLFADHVHKAADVAARPVGAERRFFADPVGAFAGDSLLGQFVAKFHFELRAVERTLAAEAGDVELALFFRRFLFQKCRRGEDEAKLVDAVKLLFEGLIGVDGETRRRDGQFVALPYRDRQVVLDGFAHVVEHFRHSHRAGPLDSIIVCLIIPSRTHSSTAEIWN